MHLLDGMAGYFLNRGCPVQITQSAIIELEIIPPATFPGLGEGQVLFLEKLGERHTGGLIAPVGARELALQDARGG